MQAPVKRSAGICLLALLMAVATAAQAEQFQDHGDYRIHYNALIASDIAPEVARQYGIRRSGRRVLLVIHTQHRDGEAWRPIDAVVTGSARNLVGQVKALEMRSIREATSRYAIGELGVANQETLIFELEILPQGAARALPLRFRQKFYTD